MPADACNTTSRQMLSTHSHTDISVSVFITVDASVSVFSLSFSEGETNMMGCVGPCASSTRCLCVCMAVTRLVLCVPPVVQQQCLHLGMFE